ncbi:MAG: hypothetical protein Q9178_007342 [Gyalolechia marmorata]
MAPESITEIPSATPSNRTQVSIIAGLNYLGPDPPHARHNYVEEDFPDFLFIGEVVDHPTRAELNGRPVFMKRCGTEQNVSDVCKYFAFIDPDNHTLVNFANVHVAYVVTDEMIAKEILTSYDVELRTSHCKDLFNRRMEDQAAHPMQREETK